MFRRASASLCFIRPSNVSVGTLTVTIQRAYRSLALLVVLPLALVGAGLAQGVNPGFPTFSGSENHGFYSINLSDLHINTSVPIRSKAGFGTVNYGGNSYVLAVGTPQQQSISIGYENTPNNPGYVTGRLGSITLPTGGTVTFGYSGGNYGLNCVDGTTNTLTRTTSDGTWTYVHIPAGWPTFPLWFWDHPD